MLRIMLNKSEQADSDQDIPTAVISAREQMYYEDDPTIPSATTAAAVPARSALKAQVEAPMRGDGLKPENALVECTYMSCDKYGDGLVRIVDKGYGDQIRSTWTKCKEQNLYFPFGFGTGNDQLKVKKLNLPASVGKTVRLSLKFSRWDRDGKAGFSCYGEIN
jgi:hypothetical protein